MTLTDIDKMLDVKLKQRTPTTQETLNTPQKAITQTLNSMSSLLTNARNTDELDSEDVLSVFQALEKEIETLHALNAANGAQPTENIMAFLLTNITDALTHIVRGLELPTPPIRQLIDYANSVKKDLTKDIVTYLKKTDTPPSVTPPSVTPPSDTPASVTPAPVTPAPVTPASVTPPSVTPPSVTPAPVTTASGKLTFCKMKFGVYIYTDENNMIVSSPAKLH